MYERFTDAARRAMTRANLEAQKLNHEYMGTEHLLLGLLWQGDGKVNSAGQVLMRIGVSLVALRGAVLAMLRPADGQISLGKLPLTPRARTVLELAVKYAGSLHHSYVGTEHVLAGLIEEGGGIAAQILRNFDVTHEKVNKEVIDMAADRGREAPDPPCPVLDPPALTIDEILAFAERLHVHRRSLEGMKPLSPYFSMIASKGCDAVGVLREYAAFLALMERSGKSVHPATFRMGLDLAGEVDPEKAYVFTSNKEGDLSTLTAVIPVGESEERDQIIRKMRETGVEQAFAYNGVLIPVENPTVIPRQVRKTDEGWPDTGTELTPSGSQEGECAIGEPAPAKPVEIDYTLNTLHAARKAILGLPMGYRAKIRAACETVQSCMCFCGTHLSAFNVPIGTAERSLSYVRQHVASLPADIRQSLQPACHASGGPCWCGLCDQEKTS